MARVIQNSGLIILDRNGTFAYYEKLTTHLILEHSAFKEQLHCNCFSCVQNTTSAESDLHSFIDTAFLDGLQSFGLNTMVRIQKMSQEDDIVI